MEKQTAEKRSQRDGVCQTKHAVTSAPGSGEAASLRRLRSWCLDAWTPEREPKASPNKTAVRRRNVIFTYCLISERWPVVTNQDWRPHVQPVILDNVLSCISQHALSRRQDHSGCMRHGEEEQGRNNTMWKDTEAVTGSWWDGKANMQDKQKRERRFQLINLRTTEYSTVFYPIMMLNMRPNWDQNKQLLSYATSPWKQLINIQITTQRDWL